MRNVHTQQHTTCYHCGEDCNDVDIHIEEKTFCCDGCKLVFEILNENDLCKYYDITQNPGIQVKGRFSSDKFAYLDDEKVKEKLVSFTDGKTVRVVFNLPQMHCSSCIWLLENLHKVNPDIVRSQVDFNRKEVTIQYNERNISLRKVVELLAFVGYEPLITLNDLDAKKDKKQNHKQLFKIGIAGFCFGNIMMLSFPEYFSGGNILEPGLKVFFSYLNLLLAIPVFFYSSSDFFVSAWKGLRQKFINIDAPVALAILVTFIRSVFEITMGTGAGYLDSMSGIVFFMLLGRFFQNFTYDNISFERDYKSYFPIAVTLIKGDMEESISVSGLRIGDRIRIKNNELIPADGILFKGEANIDYSFVTGESALVNKVLGEVIYAGGKQVGSAIELELVKDVSQSYLTQLWNNDTFQREKDDKDSFIHVLGKYFSIFLIALAIGSFLFWLPLDFQRALNAFTAVLIVACPCALLLAATFTNGNVLRIFGKNKFYLKNASVIEKLKNIDTIVFDKTGTITQNNQSDVNYEGAELSDNAIVLIRSIASQSSHPLSKGILDYFPNTKVLSVKDFKEYPGKGIEGLINNIPVKLGSHKFVNEKISKQQNELSSHVYLMINGITYGRFVLKNKYRKGLPTLISILEKNYNLVVLSGDNDSEKEQLEKIFNNNASLNFNQSPENKLNFIKNLQEKNHKVMMIGDGLNDAGALKQSDVGVAVSDNINNFSPACDAIMDASRFNNLMDYINYAKSGQKIIKASFIISLLYNTVGLWLAVSGNLSPVIAAILMPISSITIVFFTTGMSNFSAKKLLKIR